VLTALPPLCADLEKSGSLDLLKLSGLVQPFNGITFRNSPVVGREYLVYQTDPVEDTVKIVN